MTHEHSQVSEGNLTSIAHEMEMLYASNTRSSVDRELAAMVLELSGEGAGRIIGQVYTYIYICYVYV